MARWLVNVVHGDPQNPTWAVIVHAETDTAEEASAAVLGLFELLPSVGVSGGRFSISDVTPDAS